MEHDTLVVSDAYIALLNLLEDSHDVSIRFEVAVNKSKSFGFDLVLKAAPAADDFLNNDTRLNSHDVMGMVIHTKSVTTMIMNNDDCADIASLFPCSPVVFSNMDFSLAAYKDIVKSIFPALMLRFRIHHNSTYQEAADFIKNPKAVSLNVLRYPPAHKQFSGNQVPDQGIISKYGAKYDISKYIPVLPLFLINFINLHLATSTWSSYKTAWTAYFCYIQHRGLKVTLPASTQLLHGYVNYLKNWRHLKVSTIISYLSALKKLHQMNYCSTFSFECPILEAYLRGLENYEAVIVDNSFQRNAITFNILKLFGHSIFNSILSIHDKQVLWTVSLLAFWLASRMGELVSTQTSSVDYIRILTWSKIRRISHDHFTVLILRPKVNDKDSPIGHVLDIWAYDDKRYCPIHQLLKLHDISWGKGRGQNDDVVFLWQNDVPLTLRAINKYLATLLTPHFNNPLVKFSAHSFRSGLPSMMATEPDLFSEEECKLSGRWNSNTVRRYQRQHGIAHGKVMKKFHSLLKK